MEIRDGSTSLREARFSVALLGAIVRFKQGRFKARIAGHHRYRLKLERIDTRQALGRVRLQPPDGRHAAWIPLAVLRAWLERDGAR